jgi:nicotinate-nucleotide adenylyltransferase
LIKARLKIGIFGGTFNPPHIAHVSAASAFLSTLSLDKLLIIPDFLPPHKEYVGTVSALDRLNMCRLAFSELNSVEISDMEIKRGGKSYTADTLTELSRDGNELYFLAGTDMFLTMDSWYHPETIFRLATICYIRREEEEEKGRLILEKKKYYEEKYSAKIVFIDAPVIELSSTVTREAILNSSADKLLPPPVLDYINERGLYK